MSSIRRIMYLLILVIRMKRLQTATYDNRKDDQTGLAGQSYDRNESHLTSDFNGEFVLISVTQEIESNDFRNNTLLSLLDDNLKNLVSGNNEVKQVLHGYNGSKKTKEVQNSFSEKYTNPMGEESTLNYSIAEGEETSVNNNNLSDASLFGRISNSTLEDENDEFEWRKREDTYQITTPSQYPYAVLVIMNLGGQVKGSCSGSILTEVWILTASHCLDGVDNVVVYAGGNSLQEYTAYTNERGVLPVTAQVIKSKYVIMHPDYSSNHGDCDIGLVKVNGKFNMTESVNKVNLTTTPWKDSYHSYTTCKLTGFGLVQLGEKTKDDSHRKTYSLDVKNPCLCSFRLREIFGRKVASRYLCTRPKQDYGVCPGDSGGGLICGGLLRGVAMQLVKLEDTEFCEMSQLTPMKCGDINTLSIFEDVCPFLHWINKYVNLFENSSISSCKYIRSGVGFVNSSIFVVSLAIVLIHYLKLMFL